MDELDEVLDGLYNLKLMNEPNHTAVHNYESHLGKVDTEGIDKKTCAYCFVTFKSRNQLFRHLESMNVDTSPRNVIMESVEINENGKRKNRNYLLGDLSYKRIKNEKRIIIKSIS